MKAIENILNDIGLDIAETGRNDFVLFCPNHIHGKPSSKPHLWINKEDGRCHCFACDYKANIVKFVQDYLNIEREEAEEICGIKKDSGDYIAPITTKLKGLEDKKGNINKTDWNFTEYYKEKEKGYNYLKQRGIREGVLDKFEIGFDKEHNAVFIPLKDVNNRYIGYKTRNIYEKRFFNTPGMNLLGFLYGANIIKEYNYSKVAIVESEIDCLYLWTHGIPAIAVMGKSFNKEKADLLLQLGIEEVEIFTDFDEAGEDIANQIYKALKGKVFAIYRTVKPREEVKDANDFSKEEIKGRKMIKVF